MALSRGTFHPKWVQHHAGTAESTFRGTVRIERVLAEGTYDFDTGEMARSTEVWYEGAARVGKLARSVRRDFVYDTADNQAFRVQIPMEAASGRQWQSNIEVTVLTAENPALVGMVCYVRGWGGSTNDWVHTLYCTSNMKDPA